MQLLQAQGKEKEFLSLPKNQRKEYLDRAQMMSDNLRDLSEMDVSDFDLPPGTPPPPHYQQPQRGPSLRTKRALLNSLVEDIDFSKLRHWAAGSPDMRRKLGTGSFGTVYKVEYNGKEVALKHFACLANLQAQASTRDINKIRREGCILQHCASHKNVIGFYGVDLKSGIMLMELAVCSLNSVLFGRESLFKTLHADLDKDFLTTFAYKASVVNDIASALHFLHFHNIVHRDIKSQNIIMVVAPPSGMTPMTLMPKLSDFGLALAAGLATNTSPTVEGNVGTIPYNSPEILHSESAVPVYTPAVDMYALGILANEMFTERLPWQGCPQGNIIASVCFSQRRPELYVPPADEPLQRRVMDEVVGDATHGCLAQDPTKRPTAKELSFDSELLRQASVPTMRVQPGNASPTTCAMRENAAQGTFKPTAYEERKFREAFNSTRSERKVNVKAAFFEELGKFVRTEMSNFEIFATDAAEVLHIMYHGNGEEQLVSNVMLPLFSTAKDYVSMKLKDKVYQDDPSLLIQEVAMLSGADIKRLMLNMGATVNELHTQMISAAEEGTITDDAHSLRLPQLVRIMLRAYALAAVCEPKCCLLPAPGDRISYRRTYTEVFSPGAKKNGIIQENDVVQVVCPGLYIEGLNHEATLSSQPLLQCRVRRLVFGPGRRASQSFRIGPNDLRTEFLSAFQIFEAFACDATDCLNELRYDYTADMFVGLVMSPIYQTTLRWVTEQRASKTAYASQPNLILLDIQDLSDGDISTIMETLGPKVVELHNTIMNAAAKNIISNEADALRIPKIIRHFLRFHAMAALSEPTVRLEPAPGHRMAFKSSACTEILSPGVKVYGRIKEGDPVEVVLCGVQSGSTSGQPSVPCMVRRLLATSPLAGPVITVKQTDVKAEFEAALRNFDPFACDAVDCLEELNEPNPANAFVYRIMLPLHTTAKKFVTERIDKGLKVGDIAALEATNVDSLLNEAEPLVQQLHIKMLAAEQEGMISYSKPDCLRIPDMLRKLVKLHALAALSSPPCHLLPAPGMAFPFRDAHCVEILSPGAKMFGRIKDGDTVETVLCGLYFQPLEVEGVVPMVRSLVRRLGLRASTSGKSGK
jgi:serine/threonine protein kinase